MKILQAILALLLFGSCANGKDTYFTGSTPADGIVRRFLGICETDSIDFIRWKLTLNDLRYSIDCHFGVGKPNTSGFMEGGKKIHLKGKVNRQSDAYVLSSHGKQLRFFILNDNLLHLSNDDRTLLVGNGGWSYALNNEKPLPESKVSNGGVLSLKEPAVFTGRTPCDIPGLIRTKECYKLKWLISFYAGENENSGTYKVKGTPWRDAGEVSGRWILIKEGGQHIYRLEGLKGAKPIHLKVIDNNILAFCDDRGRLAVGNADFSYILNRITVKIG